jgi:hypothetical protein
MKSRLAGLIFIAGSLLCLHALAFLADWADPEFATRVRLAEKEQLASVLESSQPPSTIAIGNSHVGSLSLNALGFPGPRVILYSADMFELEYYCQYLAPRLDNLRTAFLSVSYFSFQRDNAESETEGIRRRDMYSVVPAWRSIPGDTANFVLGKLQPFFPLSSVIREDDWEGVIRALLAGRNTGNGSVFIAENDCTAPELPLLIEAARSRAESHAELSRTTLQRQPDIEQRAYEALLRILDDFEERGVEVVLFTPPYFQAYTEFFRQFDPEGIGRMERMMARLRTERNVPYYDFSRDRTIAASRQLFTDGDHLNGCGARTFAITLKERLPKTFASAAP